MSPSLSASTTSFTAGLSRGRCTPSRLESNWSSQILEATRSPALNIGHRTSARHRRLLGGRLDQTSAGHIRRPPTFWPQQQSSLHRPNRRIGVERFAPSSRTRFTLRSHWSGSSCSPTRSRRQSWKHRGSIFTCSLSTTCGYGWATRTLGSQRCFGISAGFVPRRPTSTSRSSWMSRPHPPCFAPFETLRSTRGPSPARLRGGRSTSFPPVL